MKLGDLRLDESREAELIILPEIEEIRKNEETANMLDAVFVGAADADSLTRRVGASRSLVSRLIQHHYESICVIFAALNKTTPSEIKEWKRSEANAQISEMFNDSDLISFFISSDALAQAAQYAISQKAEASQQKQQSSISGKNSGKK